MADSPELKDLKAKLKVAVANLEVAQEHQEIARTELACASEQVVVCNRSVARLKQLIESERPLSKRELRVLAMAETHEGYQLDYEATTACSVVRVLTARNLVCRGKFNCMYGIYHATESGVKALADAQKAEAAKKKRSK